ncbi:hypothetical protein [Timonella sp. A28]|uniref:hypothetical protein n=1 Tax=Timonella sp. A28 TaxID=3442640 RepID=UPI003EBBB732
MTKSLPYIALGLGILAIISIFVPPLALTAGIGALITGIIALRAAETSKERNLSWTGILCGATVMLLVIGALLTLLPT